MVVSFEIVVIPKILHCVRELQTNDGGNWRAFTKALKEEFLWKI